MLQYKKTIYILIIGLVFTLAVSLTAKPMIIFLAKRQLKKVFIGSSVNIGTCSLNPLNRLTFLDLEIKRAPLYDFKVKKAEVKYNPLLVIRKNVPEAIVSLELQADLLKNNELSLHNVSFKAKRLAPDGLLRISKIKYNKFNIENIESRVRLEDKFLFFDGLSAAFLKGNISADTRIKLDKNPQYFTRLKFNNLDLERFVQDFDLGKKVQLSGRLGGRIELQASGIKVNILNGNFTALESGGVLTIKDRSYLENIARRANQSIDLIVESFHNYHYNTGVVNFSLDKNNLVLNIVLNGQAGKRDLTVVLHDFPLTKTSYNEREARMSDYKD